MHIFLTNDDGYEAPGIVAMAKKLVALGRVTVIAPDKGRSSCSSSLSLQTYLRREGTKADYLAEVKKYEKEVLEKRI